MLESAAPVHPELIASALAWWQDAGVDQLVDEVPTPWIGRMQTPVTPVTEPQRSEAALPSSLPDLLNWLATSPDLDTAAGPATRRIVSSGPATADLMIMIDMPDAGDVEAGQLMSGPAGALFERMLAAIGRDRSNCSVTTLCPGRAPGGMIPVAALAPLTQAAMRHIAFSAPNRLWLMGQAVSRAILGPDVRPGVGRLHNFNHEGVTVASVSSFSPSFLLANPKRKAAAWADMQMLMRGIDA